MTDQPQGGPGPIPGWVWGVLSVMVVAALVCLALAIGLGRSLRQAAPEHSEAVGHQIVRKSMQAPVEPGPEAASAGPVAPMEFPDLGGDLSGPTEVPPAEAPVSPSAVQAPEEVSPAAALEVQPLPQVLRWQVNAVSVDVPEGAPKLAIVIDDMGGIMDTARRAARLPAGITLSFFPWSAPGVELARQAHAAGHEIMIHVPMEAQLHGTQVMHPGPDALTVGMAPAEVARVLEKNLVPLKDVAVGINNHMGSRFTEWQPGMRAVLTVLQREGLLFLDSKTAAPTATQAAAQGLDLPVVTRDVFLDHDPAAAAVRVELNKAVALAKKKGAALAIGHPLPQTLDVLEAELPAIVSSGVVLVPVTQLLGQ